MPAQVFNAHGIRYVDSTRMVTERVIPAYSRQLTGLARLEFQPDNQGRPAIFGHCFHRQERWWLVVSGFGILHSQKLHPHESSAEKVVLQPIYPNSVIVAESLTVYAFTFDLPAVMYGPPTDQHYTPRKLFVPGPASRLEMNLKAMAKHAGGRSEGDREGLIFDFPDGKKVRLGVSQKRVAFGKTSLEFSAQNLSQVLTDICEYLGM